MKPERLRMLLIVIVVALAVSVAAVAAFAVPYLFTSKAPVPGRAADLKLLVSTDKTEYAPGETVHITATLHNTASVLVTVKHGDSCGDSAYITDSNDSVVWIHPELGTKCLQVIVETTLSPGATIVSGLDWDQRDFMGRSAPTNQSYEVNYAAGFVDLPIGGVARFHIGAPRSAGSGTCAFFAGASG